MSIFKGKFIHKTCMLIFIVFLSFGSMHAFADNPFTSAKSEENPYKSYTYWEAYGAQEKVPVFSKPMYKADSIIDAASLGISAFKSIGDLCTDESERLYLLDSGASKIYVTDKSYKLISTIENLSFNGEPLSFEGASGIFVKDAKIYIADTKQERLLVLSQHGAVEQLLKRPESRLIPEDFVYRPIKVAVDSKGYMYVASDGSYYGALVYSPQNEFIGFYGANTVKSGVLDAIGNVFTRLMSNDIQKGAAVLALPYQFNDMAAGNGDFIYTVTGKTETTGFQTGQVSMLNPGGKDVLGRTNYNFADTNVGYYKRLRQTQSIVGIDVDEDGFFYIVDAAYGRVFWYDEASNLLSVFGGAMGTASQKGTTLLAGSIAVNGTDVLVSDTMKNNVTVFKMTAYGNLVRNAQLKTLNDDFQTAQDEWNKVISVDKNSQLAYRGLAKAAIAKGDNKSAAHYAKLGADRDSYAAAFVKLRNVFLEKHFGLIFAAVIFFTGAIITFTVIKRRKNIIIIKNEKAVVLGTMIAQPFEAFRLVKEKGKGSIFSAGLLLLVYYILSTISDTAKGFAFNFFDASGYNSFFVLLRTVGLVLLWTAANWLVCVLMGGIGKLREIFIVTCYSLLPLIFSGVLSLGFSHLLIPDEFVFVSILSAVCIAYTFFLLMAGTIKIHDFEFGKFVSTTVLTLAAMMIIVFLIFLVFLLSQQVVGWFYTLFIEAKYR